MISEITKTCGVCACCGSAWVGNIWMAVTISVLLALAIGLDFYHIWMRCRDRQERLQKILDRKKERKDGCCTTGHTCN